MEKQSSFGPAAKLHEFFNGGDGGMLGTGAADANEAGEGDAADESHQAHGDEASHQVLVFAGLSGVADIPGEDECEDEAADEELGPGNARAGFAGFKQRLHVEKLGGSIGHLWASTTL